MHDLLLVLTRLAQLQADPLDRLALHEAVDEACARVDEPRAQVEDVARLMRLRVPRWIKKPDPTEMPALLFQADQGWGLLRGVNAQEQWIVERFDSESGGWADEATDNLQGALICRIGLARAFVAGKSKVFRLIRDEFFSHKRALTEAAVGSVFINLMVLATSLYSLQVYDRVVPTGAEQTLWVLTLGVSAAIVFEYLAKRSRSGIFERLVDQVDQRLSRTVFMRLLSIRMDQLPRSVGGLAAQLRGYETVRGFLASATVYLMVDMPFGIIFIILIGFIGGWHLAWYPDSFSFCHWSLAFITGGEWIAMRLRRLQRVISRQVYLLRRLKGRRQSSRAVVVGACYPAGCIPPMKPVILNYRCERSLRTLST